MTAIPTVPPAAEIHKLSDEDLYALHEEVGQVREDLRKAQGPILTEIHRREAKANVTPAPGTGGTVGTQEG